MAAFGGMRIGHGAGFSRNARKAGPNARELPLWSEVAEALCIRLYPPGDGDRPAGYGPSSGGGRENYYRRNARNAFGDGRTTLTFYVQGGATHSNFGLPSRSLVARRRGLAKR